MQILPHGAANRARYSDVMFESRPAFRHRLLDQVFDDRTTFCPQQARIWNFRVATKLMSACDVSNNQAAKAAVANEHVGTQAKNEVRYTGVSGSEHGVGKRIGRRRLEEQIGGTANFERGIPSKRLVVANVFRLPPARGVLDAFRIDAGRWRGKATEED